MASVRPRNMYTAEKLGPAVAAATNLGEVLANQAWRTTPGAEGMSQNRSRPCESTAATSATRRCSTRTRCSRPLWPNPSR